MTAIVTETLHEAIIPALDQTRTVGLVTLPGAYIGVLLGGGLVTATTVIPLHARLRRACRAQAPQPPAAGTVPAAPQEGN